MAMKHALRRVTFANRRSLPMLAILLLTPAAQADDRTRQDYVKRVDRNSDGQIDRFEIMLVPPRHAAGLKALLAPRFKDIDQDRNNKLSMEEIEVARVARGLSPESFRDHLSCYPEVALQAADAQ